MYTHGLEKIYAFETINPKSVKNVSANPKAQKELVTPCDLHICEQLTLALGPSCQEGLPSFRLQEPLSSLGLSAFAAKMLLSKEIHTVEAACHFLRHDTAAHKGLGQSHIEELQAKIEAFVGKNPYGLQRSVDWQSLVRIACKGLAAKMRYCLLARYGLEELAGASTVDLQEIQRLTRVQIAKMIDEAIGLLLAGVSGFIETALRSITEAYVLPWLQHRHGFAPRSEVCERLTLISLSQQHFLPIFEFLTLFCDPIQLEAIEKGIYAADDATRRDYILVLECARSYFYQPFATYPIATLERFITKDLAKKGHGFKEGFIQKVLTTSPSLAITPSNHVTIGDDRD